MPVRTPTAASIRRWLVIVSLPLAIVLLALWKPDYQPPIFDAQVHYNQNAWQRVRVEAIANGIRELNVRWLLVGSTPNEGTWRLVEALPERIIPMWVPEVDRDARDRWMEDDAQLRAMEQGLRQRPYRGVGELWFNRRDIDHPGVSALPYPTESMEGYYDLSILSITTTTFTLRDTAKGLQATKDTVCPTIELTALGAKTPEQCW